MSVRDYGIRPIPKKKRKKAIYKSIYINYYYDYSIEEREKKSIPWQEYIKPFL